MPSYIMQAAMLLAFSGSILYGLYSILRIGRRTNEMPPGPAVIPPLGNEHQIPRTDGHFQLTKWAQEFGGIFSLKRFSNTTLVISDRRLIKSLLDKKSSIYSHRPSSVVADTITQGDHLLTMDYGPTWRSIRKLIHQYFMEAVCDKEHFRVQNAEAIQMVHDFLVSPDDHLEHPKRYSNSITNSLVFGIRTKTIHDSYMERLFALMDKWSLVMELGATPPVDSFPPLKWIPDFLSGRWRKRAKDVGNLMNTLYSEVLYQVKMRREAGIHRDSFMDRVLDQQEKNGLTENQLKFLGGVLMEGGSDTSSSLILAIILAMLKYPNVQARAHAEIDAVAGDDRSPQWLDSPKLPYINMIIKESHRWRPVSPLGVPHALSEEDQIGDMILPKGSTVVLNVWAMHHDPSTWHEPEHFQPERYTDFPALASSYTTADRRDHFGYGAGRRVCPGIHLAERNLIIGVAKLLWAFEFSERSDAVNDSSAETGMSQGFLHCVKGYRMDIRLRSEAKRATILRELEEAKVVFEKFD